MFCNKCGGSGEILGNGMIKRDCELCDGTGEHYEDKVNGSSAGSAEYDGKIDKRSREYKQAIKEIMDLDNVSKEEAEAIFLETYDKV